MIDEQGFAPEPRALMVAALALEVMRERHGFTDAEMDFCLGVAVQVYMMRRLPDDDAQGNEARRIILEATGRLTKVIRQMDDAGDRKTVN